MEEITDDELFELYKDTLEKCGMHLLNGDDNTLEYIIFEDFDIGVHSFLHTDNLNALYQKGFISENKMIRSMELRAKVIELQSSNEWAIEFVRKSSKWKEILSLCDEIKAMN